MTLPANRRSFSVGTSRRRPRNQLGWSSSSTPATIAAANGTFIAPTISPNDWPCVMRPANGMNMRITAKRPTRPIRRSTASAVVHSIGFRVRRIVS